MSPLWGKPDLLSRERSGNVGVAKKKRPGFPGRLSDLVSVLLTGLDPELRINLRNLFRCFFVALPASDDAAHCEIDRPIFRVVRFHVPTLRLLWPKRKSFYVLFFSPNDESWRDSCIPLSENRGAELGAILARPF